LRSEERLLHGPAPGHGISPPFMGRAFFFKLAMGLAKSQGFKKASNPLDNS